MDEDGGEYGGRLALSGKLKGESTVGAVVGSDDGGDVTAAAAELDSEYA